jgi:hypothetical protein
MAARPARGAAAPRRGGGVLVAGHQIRSQRGRRLGPARHVWAPDPLSLVVVGHPPLLRPVHLHIGGVQVDRHRLAQGRRPLPRQRGEHRRVDITHPGLHPVPLPVGQPPGQPGRGRRAQPRHRRERLPGQISAPAVQPDQEVLPRQLRRRHPDQQLTTCVAPVAGLDRPDRRIQAPNHAQVLDQLAHRRHPRYRGQRRIRRSDPHPPPQPTNPAYPVHQMGVLPTSMIVASQLPSSQVSRTPIAICGYVSRHYSRIRVRDQHRTPPTDPHTIELPYTHRHRCTPTEAIEHLRERLGPVRTTTPAGHPRRYPHRDRPRFSYRHVFKRSTCTNTRFEIIYTR